MANLYGENLANIVVGIQVDDNLYGGENTDILIGGSDGIAVGANNPIVIGNPNSGNDELYGGGGSDALYGFDGNDVLYGGSGDDTTGTITVTSAVTAAVPLGMIIPATSVPGGLFGGDGNDFVYEKTEMTFFRATPVATRCMEGKAQMF